ncbi:hypothetical protein PAAG_00658 [Paracoccidioides lutzii Pb01]|uniref:Large ribosomal subunit protein mL53 n=1 Tax=Paracoccidioides lutzii (strain ATCC MYA-826 / Pb01) TaxID=502779 RepID=C1GQ63_PARBA|nr:hypothetical protein PAAG_00658 [Paracoccidioides lutzii Pb01]EEH37737.1 hypothetical protein PAAG_00658 [Paracoccidioides lutzii Pb01]
MSIPLHTITSLRTTFSPFNPFSKPCRLFISLLQNPSTANPASPSHINIDITQLPRGSKQLPEMTVGFKGGKELRLEVGRLKMGFKDVVEEVGRIGRLLAKEESLKGEGQQGNTGSS